VAAWSSLLSAPSAPRAAATVLPDKTIDHDSQAEQLAEDRLAANTSMPLN
jgi:hypothetical protein